MNRLKTIAFATFKITYARVVFAAIFLVAFFGVNYFSKFPNNLNASERNTSLLINELKLFTDVLATVEKDYVSEVDNKKIVQGAIKGMLSALDPHSGYLDPEYFDDLQAQTKGEFGGLGIEITIKDDQLTVVSPMEDSPAAKAGVKPGDIIVRVGDEFVKGVSLVDIVKKLRGKIGTKVTISVARKGRKSLKRITIVRDKIQIKSVKNAYLGDGYGYVKISQFMGSTAKDLKKSLKKFKKQTSNFKGLVLDLRNNPGGLLTQAIQVSDLFLTSGVIVYTDGRIESQKKKYFAHHNGTEPAYPIVVLVNEGSASASEIVSGALKDHGRALIVGNQTFGKGSVQTITPLPNGGALQLTTALYFTKSGRSLQAEGVSPDVVIEPSEVKSKKKSSEKAESKEDKVDRKLRIIREKDLPGAFKNPSKKLKSKSKKKSEKKEEGSYKVDSSSRKIDVKKLVKEDPYVKQALDLLKTMSRFGKVGKK